MRPTDPLTERQLEVLRWIADRCPDGVMQGHAHKASARALASRRLVKISKPVGVWSANVTDDGRYYLEHGSFPLRKRPSATRVVPRVVRRQPANDVDVARDTGSQKAPAQKLRELSPTEQLVAHVVAAGGVLQEPRDTRGKNFTWGARQLVRDANRWGKTPPGKRLVHDYIHEGSHWYGPTFDLFTLVDGPAGTDAPLVPVPVPEDVTRYHQAVVALRKAKRLYFKGDVLDRVLRILHAVAVEAESRGLVVTAHQPKATRQPDDVEPWHLLFSAEGETVPLRIEEETDRVEHTPTPCEVKDHERRPWIPIPTHYHVDSGRLRIQIGGQSQLERKAAWADRTRWRLDDKLPEMLREVTVRLDELRLRRLAKAEAEVQYHRAVDREEGRARARAAEANRREMLEQQLTSWQACEELRGYATALATRVAAAEVDDGVDPESLEGARQWLGWVQQRADRTDPTKALATWPKPPELASYELRKFVNEVPVPDAMRYQPDTY